jgi:hypothetical protein
MNLSKNSFIDEKLDTRVINKTLLDFRPIYQENEIVNPYLADIVSEGRNLNSGFCTSPKLMGRTAKFANGSASAKCSTSGRPSDVRKTGNFEDEKASDI